jgi:hypothetical protein
MKWSFYVNLLHNFRNGNMFHELKCGFPKRLLCDIAYVIDLDSFLVQICS